MGRHEILIGLGLLIVQEGVLQVNHIQCYMYKCMRGNIEMGKLSNFVGKMHFSPTHHAHDNLALSTPELTGN